MPLFSLFSRVKTTAIAQNRDDPKMIIEEKPVSTKFRNINQKVQSHPTAFSLPVFVQHSRGFRDFYLYQEPEEEVFSISLESPVKKLSQSYDWMDRESSCNNLFESSCCEVKVKPPAEATSALELESSLAGYLPVTPVQVYDSPTLNQEAPARINKKIGRSRQLTRYFHQYECEDFMEYAVDIFDWKKSLELFYLPGEWGMMQSEVTDGMRMALLGWMVDVTRELDFSLHTWCLAVNYLDRFLGVQLISKDCLQLVGLTTLWLGAKQEELCPPTTDELVSLCADSYSSLNFHHMELIILAKLNFNLAAPTAAFFLSHLVAVEDEKEWSEDLSRHLVEFILEDNLLARTSPSKIAHSVFKVIKACDMTALRVIEGSCPKCEPLNADQWCRDFFEACLQRVVDMLVK